MLASLVTFLLVLTGLLLMFIVLLQRGRGGGLTGALGGLGGQSAFGTKAGDVFTRITVVVAVVWVGLNCASIFANRSVSSDYYSGRGGDTPSLAPAPGTGTDNNPLTPSENDQPGAAGETPADSGAATGTEASAPAGGSTATPPAEAPGSTTLPAEATPPAQNE